MVVTKCHTEVQKIWYVCSHIRHIRVYLFQFMHMINIDKSFHRSTDMNLDHPIHTNSQSWDDTPRIRRSRRLWIRFWAIPARHDDSNHRGLAMAHFWASVLGSFFDEIWEKVTKKVTNFEVTIGYGEFLPWFSGIFTQFSSKSLCPMFCEASWRPLKPELSHAVETPWQSESLAILNYPLVNIEEAIENGHRNSWFTH